MHERFQFTEMGNSPSSPPGSASRRPLLFGGPGDQTAQCAALLHQRQGAVRTGTVAIVTANYISQYNAETGDRRVRIKPPVDSISCACLNEECSLGPVLLLGGPHGGTLIYDAITLDMRSGVPKAGKPAAVSALRANGPKTVLVGYGDGSAVEVVVSTGARARAFPTASAGAGTGKLQAAVTDASTSPSRQPTASVPLHPSPVVSIVSLPPTLSSVAASPGAAQGQEAHPDPTVAGMVAIMHADGLLRLYDRTGTSLLVEERVQMGAGSDAVAVQLGYVPSMQVLVGVEVAKASRITATGLQGMPAVEAGKSAPGQKVWLWDLSLGAGERQGQSLEVELGPELSSLGAASAVATSILVEDQGENVVSAPVAAPAPTSTDGQQPTQAQQEGTTGTATTTATPAGASYRAHTAVLFTGTSDGTVYVHQLRKRLEAPPSSSDGSKGQGETQAVALRLERVIKPSTSGQALTPGPVTSMQYDSDRDLLLVGDSVGYVRLRPKATG